MKTRILLLLSCALALNAQAGSATWNLNPTTSDWNTAANWSPPTVPNGPTDSAIFGVSNTAEIFLSADAQVDSIIFDPGASAFTITPTHNLPQGPYYLTITGAGVINNSGVTQQIRSARGGIVIVSGNASAGSDVVYTNATTMYLSGTASGGEATFITNGGAETSAVGARLTASGNSTGGNATFIANGASAPGAIAGEVQLYDHANMGNATYIANPASGSGTNGGTILLLGKARGGSPRVIVLGDGGLNAGNGSLDISSHDTRTPDITIGSIEGGGEVFTGGAGFGADRNLIVGSNNLSTVFSGIIHGAYGFDGLLTKIGTGTLTLSGPNAHGAGTVINGGALKANNTTGSATGRGPVSVNAGTLGGTGIISGAVTIGTGSGVGAFLEPSVGSNRAGRLTLEFTLTFKADGTYTWRLNTRKAKADGVRANGVTIESGAQFNFIPLGNGTMAIGKVLLVIDNTGATPINGTFANLPDGSTFTVGPNTFLADYKGRDGNDLTLTVVP